MFQILSAVKKRRKINKKTYDVEFYEGKNALKSITNDFIRLPDKTVKVIGAGKNWPEFSSAFSSAYYIMKKENNVRTETILSDRKEERDFAKNSKVKNSKFKFLKDCDLTKDAVFIYEDKFLYISYDKEKPRGMIVKDKELNNFLQEIFRRL